MKSMLEDFSAFYIYTYILYIYGNVIRSITAQGEWVFILGLESHKNGLVTQLAHLRGTLRNDGMLDLPYCFLIFH